MPENYSPLTEEHRACLDRCLSSCAATAELIKLARDGGLNVDEAEQKNEEQRSIATALKRSFFRDHI